MVEILALPFMQRALIVGVLVGYLSSFFGVFVVQRGLSFLGSGLAHAAFGGVALGLLLHTEPLWIALPFTIIVAIAITWVKQHSLLGGDTAVGIFFSVSMALGVMFLFLRQEYSSEAFTYLFGSILAVRKVDIMTTAGLVLASIACWPMWKRWAYATFDSELALTDRLLVQRDDYILNILIAFTVVVAMKIIGIVLAAAFLVIPAATARLVARTFKQMTIIASVLGSVTAVLGLGLSYELDVPSGATIILSQAILFSVAMLINKLWRFD